MNIVILNVLFAQVKYILQYVVSRKVEISGMPVVRENSGDNVSS
jgi:hypothetical protein